MGSTVFVLIACIALATTGGAVFLLCTIGLIYETIEERSWSWKYFWYALAALIYFVIGVLTFPDMIKYQEKVNKTEIELNVLKKKLSKETNDLYDFEITFEDNSTVYLHSATGRFITNDIIEFTLPDNSKLYYNGYKFIKEIPIEVIHE